MIRPGSAANWGVHEPNVLVEYEEARNDRARTYCDHDTRLAYAVDGARTEGISTTSTTWRGHRRIEIGVVGKGTYAVSAPHSIVYSMSRSITVSDLVPQRHRQRKYSHSTRATERGFETDFLKPERLVWR